MGKPGQRERVAIIDRGVGGVEELELHPVFWYADAREFGPEGHGAQVEEPLVAGARVDPDRAL